MGEGGEEDGGGVGGEVGEVGERWVCVYLSGIDSGSEMERMIWSRSSRLSSCQFWQWPICEGYLANEDDEMNRVKEKIRPEPDRHLSKSNPTGSR